MVRTARALLFLVFAGTIVARAGTPAPADPGPTPAPAANEEAFSFAAIEKMARASVPIACVTNVQGKVGIESINGSGFFVNRGGDVVTAQHVIAGLGGCIPAIYVPRSGWSFTDEHVEAKWYRISSCDQDASVDIAVCHLAGNPFSDPALHADLDVVQFNIDTQPEGAPVAFTSFPLNSIHPITSVGIVAGYYWENHQRFLLVDKGAWLGASGSALYGSDGRVVGIVLQAGICAASTASCKYDGLTFAKTAGFIDGFLTQHNVPHHV
jgi:S1-C subfamily serine protease